MSTSLPESSTAPEAGAKLPLVGRLWAGPWTLVGLLLAWVTRSEPREGWWLATSRPWRWWSRRWGMAAITIGEVIICTETPSPRLLRHERAHVRQALILGPLYVPAYLLGCAVGWARGHWHQRHPMEEAARRAE